MGQFGADFVDLRLKWAFCWFFFVRYMLLLKIPLLLLLPLGNEIVLEILSLMPSLADDGADLIDFWLIGANGFKLFLFFLFLQCLLLQQIQIFFFLLSLVVEPRGHLFGRTSQFPLWGWSFNWFFKILYLLSVHVANPAPALGFCVLPYWRFGVIFLNFRKRIAFELIVLLE